MKSIEWTKIPAGSPVKLITSSVDAMIGRPLRHYEATVGGRQHLVTWGSKDAAKAQAALDDMVRVSSVPRTHPGRGQAIRTKYHGATNTRGSRITAASGGTKCTIPYPCELSGEAVHRKAAEALAAKLGWTGRMVGGELSDGWAYVFAD